MTCILYREGKGTVEHGIACESTTCEPDEVAGLLDAGWLPNPPGYVAPEPVIEEEEDPVDTDDEVETIEGATVRLQSVIDGLNDQVSILTELDDKSRAEIERLRGELVFAGEAEEALKGEIDRLNGELLAITPEAGEEPADPVVVDAPKPDATPEEVRAAAKAAGIDGWDTKRIATLENLLSEA